MNKQTLISVAALLFGIAALSFAIYNFSNAPKVAYVYNSRILNEFDGMKEGKRMYADKVKVWNGNVEELQKEVQNLLSQYEQNYKQLSKKEREETQALIEKKRGEYLNYKKVIDEKAKNEDVQMTTAILNQINSYILEYGKQQGYDYIFGVTDGGNLLYAKDADDITDKVLEALNNNYAGG